MVTTHVQWKHNYNWDSKVRSEDLPNGVRSLCLFLAGYALPTRQLRVFSHAVTHSRIHTRRAQRCTPVISSTSLCPRCDSVLSPAKTRNNQGRPGVLVSAGLKTCNRSDNTTLFAGGSVHKRGSIHSDRREQQRRDGGVCSAQDRRSQGRSFLFDFFAFLKS